MYNSPGRFIGPNCDPSRHFFKITNENENHNGFQYKDGLNILQGQFSVDGTCVPGGLYFTNPEHILDYLSYGVYLRDITLPIDDLDLKMVEDPGGDKWRANKIILGKRYDLSDANTFIYMISKGTPISPVCYHISRIAKKSNDWSILETLLNNQSIPAVIAYREILRDLVKSRKWDILKTLIKNEQIPTELACREILCILAKSRDWDGLKILIDDKATTDVLRDMLLYDQKEYFDLDFFNSDFFESLVSNKIFDGEIGSISHSKQTAIRAKRILAMVGFYKGDWSQVRISLGQTECLTYEKFILRLLESGNMEIIKFAIEKGLKFENYKYHARNIGMNLLCTNLVINKNYWDLVVLAIEYGVRLKHTTKSVPIKVYTKDELDQVNYLIEKGANIRINNFLSEQQKKDLDWLENFEKSSFDF